MSEPTRNQVRYHYSTHKRAEFPRTCELCADEAEGKAERKATPWWRRLLGWLEQLSAEVQR
jgi:hypothetical protein